MEEVKVTCPRRHISSALKEGFERSGALLIDDSGGTLVERSTLQLEVFHCTSRAQPAMLENGVV
jgi:hypothetical protein